jgi:outer membrane lipoprotein-sorting protein
MSNKNVLSVNQVKEHIQKLSESENYFSITEIEPNYNHDFTEVVFKVNKDKNKDTFQIKDIVQGGQVYKTINYSDVEKVEIDDIIVDIFLNNGTIYHLHEIRQDLEEILNSFEDKACYITKYVIVEEDDETKYKMVFYNTFEDFEVYTDTENNTVKVSNENGLFVFDYDKIQNVEEDYLGGNSEKIVRIYLDDNEYITVESM